MTTEQILKTERCYRCGGELEDGFSTVPGDRDDETGYVGDDDYLCPRCVINHQFRHLPPPVSEHWDDGWDEYDEEDRRFTEKFEEGGI